MALLVRIYFNAVFGALGGLLGWMLFGVFGEINPSNAPVFLFLTRTDLNSIIGGAIIGGMIGYFVVSVEAIRDWALIRFARLASYGVVLGAIGGALGMYIGDHVNYGLIGLLGDAWWVTMIARGIGWTFLGIAIGFSEGIAAKSLGRLSYGTIGGAIGGFVGGCLFMLFYVIALASRDAAQGEASVTFWSALGLIILGACIGSLSALVTSVFEPACLRVLRGWQEGREYPLEKQASLLGRDEHADIALFRDMKIEKQHAHIRRVQNRYVLINNNAPPENTLVNDQPVRTNKELQDGDRIQLGNVVLRFHSRAALADRRKLKRLQPVQPSPPDQRIQKK